jgi:YfiH family protein
VFTFRDSVKATSTASRVEVAFTDSSIDLQGTHSEFPEHLARLEAELAVPFARLTQVHGDEVVVVDGPMVSDEVPTGDAMVTTTPSLGLMVRVADCVPIVLADPEAGVIGVAHAGRQGMLLDVATRTVDVMRAQGADSITAWVGPCVCGACYEVPEQMRADAVAIVPESDSRTSWGTPALDIGAGVAAQLARAGVEVIDVAGCTLEEPSLHSYRRDGASAGRFAGLVWIAS